MIFCSLILFILALYFKAMLEFKVFLMMSIKLDSAHQFACCKRHMLFLEAQYLGLANGINSVLDA